MEETRKFLRYVIPGLMFAIETTFLLWILLPDWTQRALSSLAKNAELGGTVAAFLVASGVGAIFSVIHHNLWWWWPWYGKGDYRPLVKMLIHNGMVSVPDIQSGKKLECTQVRERADAWVIVTELWHERLKKSKEIEGANPRTDSLADLVHSTGSTVVASFFALVATFVIAGHVAERSFATEPILRFVFMILLGASLLILHFKNYARTAGLAQATVEKILFDALKAETIDV